MVSTIDNLSPAPWAAAQPRRPVLAPLRDWLARRWPQPASSTARSPHDELAELAELYPHTLADIGAPDHLIERAQARREMQRQEREGLRIGLASGAWQHW